MDQMRFGSLLLFPPLIVTLHYDPESLKTIIGFDIYLEIVIFNVILML